MNDAFVAVVVPFVVHLVIIRLLKLLLTRLTLFGWTSFSRHPSETTPENGNCGAGMLVW